MKSIFKPIAFCTALFLLAGCSTASNSSSVSEKSSDLPTISSGSTTVSESSSSESTSSYVTTISDGSERSVPPEYELFFTENDMYIFHAEDTEYIRNGELVPIDGATPIIEDGIMYLSLEYLFTLFKLPDYDIFKETNRWQKSTGTIYIYNLSTELEYDEGEWDYSNLINITSYLSGQNTYYDTLVKSVTYNFKYINGEIYIPAYMVDYLPQNHNAKYFQNSQTLLIYGGITPVNHLYQDSIARNRNQGWQTIYKNLASGNDPLGLSYLVNFFDDISAYTKERIVGYSLYDFDGNGVPELIVATNKNTLQIFTVANGSPIYLGNLSSQTDRLLVEKTTGYLVPSGSQYPFTYMLKNGRFVRDVNYVTFENIDEYDITSGITSENIDQYPISFLRSKVWELSIYKTVEEAIEKFPSEDFYLSESHYW